MDEVERILTQQLEIMAQQLEMLDYDQALNEMLPERKGASQGSAEREEMRPASPRRRL